MSGYEMGMVLMYEGIVVCYHYEVFHGEFLNYLTYGALDTYGRNE